MVTEDQIRRAIENLQSMDLRTVDYHEVRKQVDVLIRAGFGSVLFEKGIRMIHRGRVVSPEKLHHEVKDISYPPINKSHLTFNRASTSKHQIFYGVPTSQEPRADQLVAMLEVGGIMGGSVDEEYIQIGQWTVEKSFRVVTLGLHGRLHEANKLGHGMKTEFDDIVGKQGELGRNAKLVNDYMAVEFAKKVQKNEPWQYKISAAYGDALWEIGFGALLFPSVKADGKEFNIAIKSDLVDKALKPRVGAVARLRKVDKAEIAVDWFMESPTVVDGRFNWKPPPGNAVIDPVDFKRLKDEVARRKTM